MFWSNRNCLIVDLRCEVIASCEFVVSILICNIFKTLHVSTISSFFLVKQYSSFNLRVKGETDRVFNILTLLDIPSKELQDRLQQLGHQHITRIVEWSLPHPADENGNIGGEKWAKDQSKRLGSGSSTLRRRSLIYWVWRLRVDHYGLLFWERSRLWRIAKTVIVRLESVKKHVVLWTTPKMCEMTAIDW